MSWFRAKDGRKVDNVPWQERWNVQYWIPNPINKDDPTPVPFKCERCNKEFSLYGDESGLHCIPCWVEKKAA